MGALGPLRVHSRAAPQNCVRLGGPRCVPMCPTVGCRCSGGRRMWGVGSGGRGLRLCSGGVLTRGAPGQIFI